MPIGTFAALDHVFVTMTTNEELAGHGEVTLIPQFMGEAREQVLGDLRLFCRHLKGADPEDLEQVLSTVDRVAPRSLSARAAIDVACHDLIGRKHGLPTWRLLGHRQRQRVKCTWAIGLKSPKETVAEAVKRRAEGYDTFKVKVGDNDDEDYDKVRLMRLRLGPEPKIRLDANGAYSSRRALAALGRMASLGLEMVEQPCASDDLPAMALLRRTTGLKILADESVFSPADAERVIDAGAADFVNIKIQKLGGLRRAGEVATLVENAGLACIVGSCLEVGPGVAASAHFAVSCRSADRASDLTAGLQHVDGARAAEFGGLGPSIHEPAGPGLGMPSC